MEQSGTLGRHPLLRQFIGRPRLMLCSLLALVLFFVLPDHWKLSTRMLLMWNVSVLVYIAAALVAMAGADEKRMRRNALMTDEGRFVVLALTCGAAVASIAAIIIELSLAKDIHGPLRAFHISLAGVTILSSWVFIHVIFAQHYAHEYFIERDSERALPEGLRGGLKFPDPVKPDYSDFLYFAFVIGVASQTADVDICSRPMRRLALAHCVLSFFFNTTVLALTINIAAGMIGS